MQYISSDRRGYKTKTNIIYSVKDNAFIHCDFLVVNSQKLVYRIYIKNYNYDDIFWKVMQMPTNSKKSNSLRASGAFKAPSILLKKGEVDLTDKYDEHDAKSDTTITYVQTGMKVAKLYAPSVILCASSLGCLLASNNILRKRNAALTAAYATIDKSFKEYRKRVSERFGDEVEKEIRYNIKAKEITTVDEDGNEVKETVKEVEVDPNSPESYSDYARFFDESCAAWQNDAEYNLTFLKAQQQYANDLLKARGRLFLNEVYRMLGIDETKAGQVVGWVYNPDNPTGDNFVDFGIYNMQRERVRAFVNGYEPNILLDFNVDGVIWDLAW